MNEEGSGSQSEYDQRPKATRLSLAKSRDALLNHSAAQVDRNQSSHGLALQSAASRMPALFAKRENVLVLKVLAPPHQNSLRNAL